MPRLTLAGLALLALTACTPSPGPDAGPALRDTARPIYSTASFDLAQLDGMWMQRGSINRARDCSPGGLDMRSLGSGGMVGSWILCLGDRRRAGQGEVRAIGPGRFALPELDEPVWVLWVDADNRTLVLGTPSGAFGVILDRKGDIPADRKTAATDILAWNGYDIGLLQFWPE